MVENKDIRRGRSGNSRRMINSQPLDEVFGQDVGVNSHGLSQPIAEIVIDEKSPVQATKTSVPSESDNQTSSSNSLNENR